MDAPSDDELRSWLTARIGRVPEHTDVFQAATQLFHGGDFEGCARALRLYLTMPGHEANGYHLLGHALFRSGELDAALAMLKRAVARSEEFEADWQLLVQIQLDLLGVSSGGAASGGVSVPAADDVVAGVVGAAGDDGALEGLTA